MSRAAGSSKSRLGAYTKREREMTQALRLPVFSIVSVVVCAGLCACGTPQDSVVRSLGEARPGTPVIDCSEVSARLRHPATVIDKAEAIAAGQVRLTGMPQPLPAHCVVSGRLQERISPVDGKRYAIGFEARLPASWNGRFFYQANGGLDGFVTQATGNLLGGGPRESALHRGFAVLSSDAGHALDRSAGAIGGGVFGLDPQARLDYGYQAVPKLTSMARALLEAYYGRAADRSYLVGSSNGGRHGFVAAARDTGAFDGIAVTTPGYRLPRAALAQLWGAQQFAAVTSLDPRTGRPDMKAALTPADMALLAQRVRERCDALDGLADGIVSDTLACQRSFDIERDVPTCPEAREAGCLDRARKTALARVFAGPAGPDRKPVYAPLPWDPGVAGKDWAAWKLEHSVGPRDAVAVAYVFSTPPASPAVVTGQGTTLLDFALAFDVSARASTIDARQGPYTESAMEFMTPPDEMMKAYVARGGKLLVAHGVADPVFSALDTAAWFDRFTAHHGASTADRARLYLVPGMNHSRDGVATDQFDLVSALVAWVERGERPEALVATARGPGSNLPNPELPASWSTGRTRLLCPYPQVARYRGHGDPERAESFQCTGP